MNFEQLLELPSKFQIKYLFSVNAILSQFYQLINLKWQLDFMITKDSLCKNYRWTKFEVESLRYSLSHFFYGDDKTFEKLRQDNITVYSVFVTYLILILILLIIALIFYPILALGMALFIFIVFFIIIMVINGLFTKSYDDIYNYIYMEDSDIFEYYAVYKILSAVMIISNLKDEKLEYVHDKLNESKLTFDDVLERNIASYENISQSSKVISIKQDAYKNLDFLKYVVFDKTSPYYLKYFDNVYARLPNADNHYFLSELKTNKPQQDEQAKKITEFYTKLKAFYDNDKNADKTPIQFIDNANIQFIDNANNKKLRSAETLKKDILEVFDDNNKQKELNNYYNTEEKLKIYSDLKNIIKDIKYHLANTDKNYLSNTDKYSTLNSLISDIFNNYDIDINVADNDYIKFYLDNKDVLTDDTKTQDIVNKLKYQTNFIYSYFVFLAILFFCISHLMYIYYNSTIYVYILLSILSIYILFIWMYTHQTFVDY
jgi:hypothetical protein